MGCFLCTRKYPSIPLAVDHFFLIARALEVEWRRGSIDGFLFVNLTALENPMQLKGTWYNELGSEMILTTVQAGRVEGTYETFVSECAKGKYLLIGRTDTDNDAAENIGFVVSWENENGSCDSVTTWSGEVQTDKDGEEVIRTTWLLTMETAQNANWKSTLIGKDTFTRTKPTKAQIDKILGTRDLPHPR